jgi:hypothetical protein
VSIYTGVLERAAASVTMASAATFATLSRVRGKRFFHPEGETFEGSATITPTSLDLPFTGTTPVHVRFSRGAGLPGSLPDVFGLALRFPELDHDLLLATSGTSMVTRHLLLPATSFFSAPYSTILPYEYRGRLIVFGAAADGALQEVEAPEVEDLGPFVATGRLRFDLTVAGVGDRSAERFASVVIDRPHDGDIKFNPWRCHPALRPAGPLNRLRLETYEASQAARPPEPGGPQAR